MCEILWSGPQPNPGRGPSKRGVGLPFGGDVTKRLLKDNNLDLVVRSHEVKDEGYEIEHDGKLMTVFSAPNYCDQERREKNHQCDLLETLLEFVEVVDLS
ncbi:putative protein-serine/threonine phosphatase [Helianthus annuus]|uniref:Putative serine/threonine protein phosphatase 5, Metallo-dependent phosphatase-like protein n=2 Tax=Helianthus annuus TaxID=4232 RepID=A0A251V2X6_HELAN|nr:putative protein-serine/threonine phosphatase [Helianthus annuus]KAJ0582377.1 putative protein-serine/threonine phosphatase [Helianthus annuus]KAJ0598360.1 putative protein-serine/threonine phosphatase [Helianthus annuus]KAJ0758974.1 putative protein-serine/threonine phosphatase [Helianthus annuus]KAJ0762617.1 putative protein-serine/threonine phosphatase [Helianthus annuus]